VQINATILDPL